MPTVFDALRRALAKAAEYNHNDTVAPEVILWPDKDRQWSALAKRLRAEHPEFLTLGDYKPDERTGPGIWLRCVLARTIDLGYPATAIPILYLPGVGRADLRAVETCPKHLQPLAELQFRGCFWTHINGKDWTVTAFLQSPDGGLGLDVVSGPSTSEAVQRALLKLAGMPVEQLRGKQLDAAFFNELLSPDTARDLLAWLNDPAGTRKNWSSEEWTAFRSVCQQKFKFDPQTDGELTGAERLGDAQGPWEKVWKRFAEAPRNYPHLPKLLSKAKPMLASGPTWPQENESDEDDLRKELKALKDMTALMAIKSIFERETEHAKRREWVWTALGQAPLACALKYLVQAAEVTKTPLAGATTDALADAYATTGWRADAAVLDALACVEKAADAEAVSVAVQAIYKPWLAAAAELLQKLAKHTPLPGPSKANRNIAPGTCVLFADGLRFDVAQKLHEKLSGRGLVIETGRHWSALPSVTPTAKPAVSPVAGEIVGGETCIDFRPNAKNSNKELLPHSFKKLLDEENIQHLALNECGNPSGTAWTEYGDMDAYGHAHGWKLAQHVGHQVREIEQRIEDLLAAGWLRVEVVTDHGWLLMPGGLPKIELPGHLADTRWGRCAALKATTSSTLPNVPWHWNPDVIVTIAPGIGCFKANTEYAHGSVSLQECLVPTFTIRKDGADAPSVKIKAVKWAGLRCRITLEGVTPDCMVDVRKKAVDAGSSVEVNRKPQVVKPDGTASVVVSDDTSKDDALLVVVLDANGQLLAKKPTTVGGEE